MLGWFNAGKAEEFGTSLAQFFIEKMPPGQKLNESKLASKTEYLLVKMQARIKEFKQTEKLNIYKTAKLANAFRWTLKDANFEAAFIEKLVEWLVTHL
jgi:hypothetical protein